MGIKQETPPLESSPAYTVFLLLILPSVTGTALDTEDEDGCSR